MSKTLERKNERYVVAPSSSVQPYLIGYTAAVEEITNTVYAAVQTDRTSDGRT